VKSNYFPERESHLSQAYEDLMQLYQDVVKQQDELLNKLVGMMVVSRKVVRLKYAPPLNDGTWPLSSAVGELERQLDALED
jgi:hypothetical protein